MKANYHTHTELCNHAGGLPEDYAQEALSKGLSVLGISDHAPFPDKDYGFRMGYDKLDLYIDLIQKAKELHKNEIEILASMEIEYLPQYTKSNNYYEMLLTKKNFDYLLLGEHFFQDKYGTQHNITSVSNTELVIEYAKACAEAMDTGYFKILAHPDLFCINELFPWNDDYEKASDILIDSAKKNGVILEYNANGLRRGIRKYPDGERYQYPHIRFWSKVQYARLPAIVGSDAHSPDVLWDSAVQESIRALDEMKITRIEELKL